MGWESNPLGRNLDVGCILFVKFVLVGAGLSFGNRSERTERFFTSEVLVAISPSESLVPRQHGFPIK